MERGLWRLSLSANQVSLRLQVWSIIFIDAGLKTYTLMYLLHLLPTHALITVVHRSSDAVLWGALWGSDSTVIIQLANYSLLFSFRLFHCGFIWCGKPCMCDVPSSNRLIQNALKLLINYLAQSELELIVLSRTINRQYNKTLLNPYNFYHSSLRHHCLMILYINMLVTYHNSEYKFDIWSDQTQVVYQLSDSSLYHSATIKRAK